MNNDIVERLRQKYAGQLPICTEAADEIERLRGICDMLANRLRSGSDSGWDDAIDAWGDVSEFGNDPESQGSAKLSPNSETNVDDSVKSLIDNLRKVSRSMWISDEEGRVLLEAASLIGELAKASQGNASTDIDRLKEMLGDAYADRDRWKSAAEKIATESTGDRSLNPRELVERAYFRGDES